MIKLILLLKRNKYFIAVLWAFVPFSLARRCCLVVQRHFAAEKCIRTNTTVTEFLSTKLFTSHNEDSRVSQRKLPRDCCQYHHSNDPYPHTSDSGSYSTGISDYHFRNTFTVPFEHLSIEVYWVQKKLANLEVTSTDLINLGFYFLQK